jgi:hypothetical protein
MDRPAGKRALQIPTRSDSRDGRGRDDRVTPETGFLMLTFSEFSSIALGAATAATMIVALLGDLSLLPSLLALIEYAVNDQDLDMGADTHGTGGGRANRRASCSVTPFADTRTT